MPFNIGVHRKACQLLLLEGNFMVSVMNLNNRTPENSSMQLLINNKRCSYGSSVTSLNRSTANFRLSEQSAGQHYIVVKRHSI